MLTRAIVDVLIQNNATWQDAFQFGDTDDAPDTAIALALATDAAAAKAASDAAPDDVDLARAWDKAQAKADRAAVAAWDFTNKTFRLDVREKKSDAAYLLSLTTANGRIVVDDAVKRILHFNVVDTDISANLPVGRYVYDLIMLDNSTPAVRVALMGGTVTVVQGVTGD